jgi:hypothetical protein
LQRTTPRWLGYVGESLYESRIELPMGWSAAQPMALDLRRFLPNSRGSTEVHDSVVITKRCRLLKASLVTPDQYLRGLNRTLQA